MNNQKGGSLASDYVMALTSRPCDKLEFPLPEKVNFKFSDIINNYGSEFKTTGGGLKKQGQRGGFGMDNIEKMARDVAGNRVLDLYLKYLGITLLTPATLVPIALIMGKQTFEQVVKDMKKNDQMIQTGGEGFLDVRIPIVDDELIGNALKLAGLTALNITPYTLVPLGVLMYIYANYLNGAEENQQGGGIATVLPAEYFGRRTCSLKRKQRGGYPNSNLDTPALKEAAFGTHCPPADMSNIQRPYSEAPCPQQKGGKQRRQRGGSRSVFGNDIPPNMVQRSTELVSGQDFQWPRGDVYDNREMQITNAKLPSQLDYNPPYAEQIETPLLPEGAAECASSQACARIPQQMAGGKRQQQQRKKQSAGASSDWISTNYSRGPWNTYDMDPAQFAMFNKTSPYITNRILVGENANPSSTYYNFPSYMGTVDYKPLYAEDIPCAGPLPVSEGLAQGMAGGRRQKKQQRK